MNNKNLVIATIVGITLFASVTFPEVKVVGDNEVAKVPSVYADVPHTLELPFLYSQKLLTTNVQKEGMAFLPKATTIPNATPIAYNEEIKEVNMTPIDPVRQESATEGKEDSFIGYDVPLSADLQKYTKDLCEKYGISYELIVATIKVESNFDHMLVSPTNDYGLMQINRSNFAWIKDDLKKEFGITWDWKNQYHNVLAGVWYYHKQNDDLVKMGYSNENVSIAVLSYNMGTLHARSYLKNHNARDWSYVRKVLLYKTMLEKGESINDNKPKGTGS
jgi:hypothetical protein